MLDPMSTPRIDISLPDYQKRLGAWLLRRYVTRIGGSCDRVETAHILTRIKIALPEISESTLLLRQRALYYRMTALTLRMRVFGPRCTLSVRGRRC